MSLTVYIGSSSYPARRLTRKELASARNKGDWELVEFILDRACSLNAVDMPFGLAIALADQIYEASLGVDMIQVFQTELDRIVTTPEFTNNVLICTAFPQYKFADLDNMDWAEWTKLSARAHWKLLQFHGITAEELDGLLSVEARQQNIQRSKDKQYETYLKFAESLGGTSQEQDFSLFDTLDDRAKEEIMRRAEEMEDEEG